MKKIMILAAITICIVLMVSGFTLSYFTSADSVVNTFSTGSIEAKPVEPEYREPTSPEQWEDKQYHKTVKVQNTGKNDCLIRVSITPRWVDSYGNPWAGDVSANVVELGFVNLINEEVTEEWPEEKWIKGNDQWYYYTSILPVATTTNSELLSYVKANIKDNVKVTNAKEYEGKILNIDVKVEAVQTTQGAYSTVWNMNLAGQYISELLKSITNNQ